jgi:hypothetical protein
MFTLSISLISSQQRRLLISVVFIFQGSSVFCKYVYVRDEVVLLVSPVTIRDYTGFLLHYIGILY